MAFKKAIIIDAEQLFIAGFDKLLYEIDEPRVELLYSTPSGAAALDYLKENDIDIVFMDLNLSDIDGLELIPKIKQINEEILVCVVSAYTEPKFVKTAMKKGANAFYSKNNSQEELANCLNIILIGSTFISQGLKMVPSGPKKDFSLGGPYGKFRANTDRYVLRQKLTRREHEVLPLIIKAMKDSEIAKQLYISPQTAKVHRKNIMRKLGVRDTSSLIKFALDNKIAT